MTSRASSLVALVSGCLLPLLAMAADSHDPGIGVWHLDLAKSSLHDPIPKSETRTYVTTPDGSTKMTLTGEEADGKKVSAQLTYKLDGKDYPVKDQDGYDAVAATLVDQYTVKFDLKKAGKTVGSFTRTVSPDGKTLTAHSEMSGPDGKSVSEKAVYSKQ